MMITKRSAVAPASTARPRRLFVAWVISFAAVGIGVFHAFMPDVKIDGITLVLAAIAVVPWLGDLFESIELPGGTKLQYLQQRIDETEQFTQEVRHAADDAARQARVALVTSGSENIAGDSPAEKVAELTHAFTELRRTEPSSPGRTYRQEQIFAELVRLTPQLADMNLQAALGSNDGGTRLTAYARLYAKPEAQYLKALVEAAVAENMHFNQYWAIHAVGAVVDAIGPGHVDVATVRRLRRGFSEVPEDSDRARTLRGVLARLDHDAA
ncbi:hypothetical protein [Streptomyces virginiae]|uniref:hypothetical protein n=1 Tax=Streptomyces virginiae TaxID=1961 RepID=UPI002250A2C9|nr:hypothetical protein [Streptomyces virginiae]MCX4721941.1 hypothetical protein [Streptomyces virginiae]MCX5276860.1 hypothetical protein [Streptomyces virginiae]